MRQPTCFPFLLLVFLGALFSCQADDPKFTPGDVIDAREQVPRIDAGNSECPGCVEASGTCRNGNAEKACGGGGAVCQSCDPEDTCEEQVCTPPPTCSAENCSGCCNSQGECVAGTTSPAACGTGGNECTQCSSGVCEAGACRQLCNSTTCTGCCTGATIDTCVPFEEGGGQSDTVCGKGGNSCSTCPGSTTCTVGICIDTSCGANCANGCCDGASCETGNTNALCGSSANACVSCGAGLSCSSAGVCETDLTTLWDFVILSADVPSTDAMGDAWDFNGGAPDVYITVDIGDSPGFSGSSGAVNNEYLPVYSAPNGQVVVPNVPAEILLQKIKFTIYDEDIFDDDLMSEIIEESPTSFMFGGSVLLRSVGSDENLYTVRFKLVPR
ncbi:MAG: hypothetical protein JKY56_06500 [Kofleriaceae bacterium]|nr:hypothetical protein [Kofleriaceae bacterium]